MNAEVTIHVLLAPALALSFLGLFLLWLHWREVLRMLRMDETSRIVHDLRRQLRDR